MAYLVKNTLTVLLFAACCVFSLINTAMAQSDSSDSQPIADMNAEELAAYIKEQELQLEAVKQARDAQKEKFQQVQDALQNRQEKLNEIMLELAELCEKRKELDPSNTEACMPDDS